MKNLFEKYGKKKVYLIGIIASLSILAIIIVFGMMNDNPLKFKQDSFIVEYGDTVSTNAKTYLTTEDKDILDNAKIDLSELKKEKDKDYIAIGKYDAMATYKNDSIKFSIEVKDTKAPTFKDIMKEIVVEQNAEDVDFTKFFKTEDMSDVNITVDNKTVDLAKLGSYETKVTAKDKYENAVTKSVNVKVISLEEVSNENAITKTLDDTVYQSKAMKEKLEEENKKVEEEKVEEQKKVEQKKEEQNNNTSNGNTSSSGNAGNGNINNGNTTNGGGTSNGGTVEPPKPNVCVPDGNFGRVGNSGKVFYGKAEADKFANDFIVNQVEWIYQGYTAFTVYDNCGERNDVWTVNFYS